MMISHSTRKFFATVIAGAATGALFQLVNFGSTPQQPLMQLERVVIVGKSTPAPQQVAAVQQLPRVLVEGRRAQSQAPLLLARAEACTAPLLC